MVSFDTALYIRNRKLDQASLPDGN
jgi:hypothetical protein